MRHSITHKIFIFSVLLGVLLQNQNQRKKESKIFVISLKDSNFAALNYKAE
jgi:hypothetical protein